MSAYGLIPTCRDARLVRPGNVVYTPTVLCPCLADARAVRPYFWVKGMATENARLGALRILIKVITNIFITSVFQGIKGVFSRS